MVIMVFAFSNCSSSARRWRFGFVGAVSVSVYAPPRHLYHLAESM
jgi:hypothetical protein